MILKNKTIQHAVSPTAKAGQKQEQNVAFFLRRAFKDHKQVYVINDFKFTHNNETAQIDHLIVYEFGFVLIESKSVSGEVKVNDLGEWTRSYNNNWAGIPSPIKQVELQQVLLKEMLHDHREDILGKLAGIKQQSFGGRCWDNLCAISSTAIIDRESMPSDISKKLVKTEFLVETLEKLMNLKSKVARALTFDSRPDFSGEELDSITSFLMAQLVNQNANNEQVIHAEKKVVEEKNKAPQGSLLKCKACGEESDFTAQHGRYGYFIKCNKCETNTAMKMPCLSCNSKSTKVSKKKESYTLKCSDCEQGVVLI